MQALHPVRTRDQGAPAGLEPPDQLAEGLLLPIEIPLQVPHRRVQLVGCHACPRRIRAQAHLTYQSYGPGSGRGRTAGT